MILAFINDPIQTAFIYMIGASFILCIYLLTYSLCSYVAIYKKKNVAAMRRHLCGYKYDFVGYIFFTLAGGLSIAYF